MTVQDDETPKTAVSLDDVAFLCSVQQTLFSINLLDGTEHLFDAANEANQKEWVKCLRQTHPAFHVGRHSPEDAAKVGGAAAARILYKCAETFLN